MKLMKAIKIRSRFTSTVCAFHCIGRKLSNYPAGNSTKYINFALQKNTRKKELKNLKEYFVCFLVFLLWEVVSSIIVLLNNLTKMNHTSCNVLYDMRWIVRGINKISMWKKKVGILSHKKELQSKTIAAKKKKKKNSNTRFGTVHCCLCYNK